MIELEDMIKEVAKLKLPPIWMGDINVDMNPKNDVLSKPDLKIIKPMFEDILSSNSLAIINEEPTWFQPGRRESLLDLFVMSHLEHSISHSNVINVLSQHAGVILDLNLALSPPKKQFITIRDYSKITWTNLEPFIDANNNLNELFAELDPDIIANKLNQELNNIANQLITKTRIQYRK